MKKKLVGVFIALVLCLGARAADDTLQFDVPVWVIETPNPHNLWGKLYNALQYDMIHEDLIQDKDPSLYGTVQGIANVGILGIHTQYVQSDITEIRRRIAAYLNKNIHHYTPNTKMLVLTKLPRTGLLYIMSYSYIILADQHFIEASAGYRQCLFFWSFHTAEVLSDLLRPSPQIKKSAWWFRYSMKKEV